MTSNIVLAGGKSGGGSSFSERDNTLKSNTYVSTLEGLGYGLQLGPVNGLQSVYLDDTPLYDSSNKPNFSDVSVDFRYGAPSQTAIVGFEEVGAPVTVATDCVCPSGIPTAVTRTVSSANISAASVTIRLPQGLSLQDTNNNTLGPTTLEFDIKTKLTSSGTWVNAIPRVKYNDKTTSPYEESFRIQRPAGTGTWDIRIERVTPDSTSATQKDTLNWAYFTEYDTETVTYPNVALLGVKLNASGVNATRIPTRSVDWYGRIIQVPSVFDPKTRTFSGIWDLATFQNAWTDDPAWIIYDLATDDVVGLGLDPSQIDIASIYEASIYNSTAVSFTGNDGLVYTGPRFCFSAPVTEAATGVDWLKRIAATMNATLLWVNGQLTLVQDRPDTFKHVFTNANVVGGRFTRAGTPDDTRYTVCNVTWNAPADGYKQRVTSVEDTAGIASYGYLETNVAALGCTSMSQAIRYGKWILDSSLYTTTTVSFTTGAIGAVVIPGDIIRVYDNTYAALDAAGRLLAGSTTTVLNLDRPVSFTAGSTITVWGQDGTMYTDVAVSTTGTVSTITLATPLASAPVEGSIFQATTNSISPELYRVTDREETEDGKFTITAGLYDANKWARIEGGVVLPTPRYSDMIGAIAQPPTSLTFNERSVYVDLTVQRKLHITWTPVIGQVVTGYRVTYTMNGGNKTVVDVKTPGVEIDIQVGLLLVTVQSLSYGGLPSLSLDGTYTVAATETTGSVLNAPTSLGVYPGGGTTFATRDLIVQWTNPTTNGATTQGVVRFKVEVYNGATLLRSEYVGAVAPGQVQTYVYSYDANTADGGPRRSPTIKVYCQDASRKLSGAATATFTNASPAAPSGLVVTGGVGQLFVTNTLPVDTDYKGTLVWASLTTGFTPSSANLVYDGSDNVISFKSLGAGVHYVKVAHYDSFGKDLAGTGLNLSSQQTATPIATAGIPSGSATPGTGAEGDLFYNTTDGKLYRYHSGVWTTAVPTVDLTGTISTAQIADAALTTAKFAAGIEPVTIVSSVPGTLSTKSIFNTTDSKVYRWNGTAYVATVPTTDLTGTISTAQIAANAVTTAKFASGIEPVTVVSSVPGTLSTNTIFNTGDDKLYRWNGTAYVSSVPTTDLTGTITTTQITDGSVTTPKVASNSITTNKLVVTGRGQELNADPNITDLTAWNTGGTLATGITDIPTGGSTAIQTVAGARTDVFTAEFIPIDQLNNYRLEIEVKQTVGTAATAYLGVYWYDGAKAQLTANVAQPTGAGSPAGWLSNGTGSYYGLSGTTVPTTWTTYSIGFGPGETAKTPSNARYCRIIALLNYNNTASAVVQLARAAIMRKVDGNLVVDGSITAAKIAADTITAGQIAAGAISTSELATGAVTATNIAASTITANEIAASTITGAKIAASTITASNIAANTITAGQIAANTITASQIAADTITAGQIAAGAIGASEVAANAITTDKLFVTGRGKALNDDPACSDISAWTTGVGVIAVQTDATAPVGKTSLRTTGSGAGSQFYSRTYPVEAGKTYKVSLYAKQVSGAGLFYLRMYCYTAGGTLTSQFVTGLVPTTGLFEGLTVPGTWTRYTGYITPAAGCVYGQVFIHTNWATTGVTDLCDIRAEEYIGADLIVDGAITAAKIAANTITASQIAADTITASQIAANAITSSELAANSVIAGKINAGAVSTNELAANAVTAAKIAANTITASQIAAGTITANEIAGSTITAAKIATGTITANEIAGSTITAAKIATGTITATQMATGTITAASGIIANAAIGTAQIGDLNVTTLKIADNAVTIPVLSLSTTPVTGTLTASGGTTSPDITMNIATISFTSNGNAVKIDCMLEMAWTSVGSLSYVNGGAMSGTVTLSIDGTVVLTPAASSGGLSTSGTTTSYIFYTMPWTAVTVGAGTHTISFDITYRKTSGPLNQQGAPILRTRGLYAIEVMK